MNKVFAEYTTSTAFAFTLTKNQCNALLRIHETMHDKRSGKTEAWRSGLGLVDMGCAHTLEAKGLIYWSRDSRGIPNGFKGLTRAGRLMVMLLREAELTVENTNGPLMMRRLGRKATMDAIKENM